MINEEPSNGTKVIPSAKLGSIFVRKSDNKRYILRRMPIKNNHKEERQLYLTDEDTKKEYIYDFDYKEYTILQPRSYTGTIGRNRTKDKGVSTTTQ